MTLRDVYTCWKSRGDNPIYTARIPPRVRVGQMLFLLILVGISAVYFSLSGFGDEEAFVFIMLLWLAWPFLCAMYFFFFSGRSFRDEFLQDVHLTALSRQEVLFGASFSTLRLLLAIPVVILLVTVPMLSFIRMNDDLLLVLAVYLIAWTVFAAISIVVWREWVSQPGRVLAVLVVSYIRSLLGFLAGAVLFMLLSLVMEILTPMSRSATLYKALFLLLIFGLCVFILFHRVRDSLAVAEHALFRRVTPDHWPDVVWYANEKRPPRLSADDRAFIRRAFAHAGWASVMVFGGLLAVSLPMLLTQERDLGRVIPHTVWHPTTAFLNGFASIQASLLLAVFTAVLLIRRLRNQANASHLPMIANWRRGTLAVYMGAAVLPIAIHSACCLAIEVSNWEWRVSEAVSFWLFLLFVSALLLNAINASLLSGIHRRRRAILWMLFALASWGLSFTDDRIHRGGDIFIPSNNERYYLGLMVAFAIAAHGLVSWVPRLMQEWWLVDQSPERNSGESGQPSIATGGGAFP